MESLQTVMLQIRLSMKYPVTLQCSYLQMASFTPSEVMTDPVICQASRDMIPRPTYGPRCLT